MFKEKVFKVPLYPFKLRVIVTNNTKKLHKIFGGEPFDNLYGMCLQQSIKGYNAVNILLNPDEDITAGIIAHECIHAKNIIFNEIGYEVKTYNDEAEAYLMQWLVERTYNFYKNGNN